MKWIGALVIAVALCCSTTHAGTMLMIPGDVTSLGDMIESGDVIWPGTVDVEFSDDYSTATATFVLTANFDLLGLGAIGNEQVFQSADGTANIAFEMSPISALNDETVGNIVNAEFEWGPQPLSDPPTTFLTLEGGAIPVSEPSTIAMLGLAGVTLGGMVLRSARVVR